MTRRTRIAMALSIGALLACSEDGGGGPTGDGLQGTWRAAGSQSGTYFGYKDAVDSIEFTGFGGVVTLVLGSPTFTLTVSIPIVGTFSENGSYTVSNDTIRAITTGQDTFALAFDQVADVLDLEGPAQYDFDADGTRDSVIVFARMNRN